MNILKEILDSSSQIVPEWILLVGILVEILLISFSRKKVNKWVGYLFTFTIIFYLFSLLITGPEKPLDLYNGMLTVDKLATFIKHIAGLSALIFMVHARIFNYKFDGEVFVLLLFILLGISFISMSTHFLVIFISLELISISSYVLVTVGKNKENFEAGIKYLILGATASAIMLFGVSLFYGMTHSLNFMSSNFAIYILQNPSIAVQITNFMVLGAFLFKIGSVPFHYWVPDVYESTSTPIISFLSFAPKAAGFVVISRLVAANFSDINYLLALIVLLSLTVGNFAALWQTNFKRLLGYSAIAQSGFILIGLIKFQSSDFYGAFFYLVCYLPITMGAFFLADLIYKKVKSYEIIQMQGLLKKYPVLSINAIIILIALIGLPPTVGFTSKFVVFNSLAQTATATGSYLYYAVLIYGLLNAAIAIYYYLKPVYMITIKEPKEMDSSYSFDFMPSIVLSYFGFIILYLFFNPDFISDWVKNVFN